MAVNVLHYYRMKAAFLPPELPSLGIYVRPGELAEHVNPNHWDIVGSTYHPNQLQARDVERHGYCLRPGVPETPRGRGWYLASKRAIKNVLKATTSGLVTPIQSEALRNLLHATPPHVIDAGATAPCHNQGCRCEPTRTEVAVAIEHPANRLMKIEFAEDAL